MTKFRWAKYDHHGVFHDAATGLWSDVTTACGIATHEGTRNGLHRYTGRGTATSCKRCLRIAQARKVKLTVPRKLVLLGYCGRCGKDVEVDFCDHCGRYVQESPHDQG